MEKSVTQELVAVPLHLADVAALSMTSAAHTCPMLRTVISKQAKNSFSFPMILRFFG
jgi:hypothetical protein